MRTLLVCLAVAAFSTAGCGGSDDTVTVPKLVGLPYYEAECLAAERGLRWQAGDGPVRSAPYSCDSDNEIQPDPEVRRQTPTPGTKVKRGTVIRWEDACSVLRFRKDGAACA